MTFGARLKEARKRARLTQRQVAEQIGAKHNSVSNWENGLNMPDPIAIERICRLLNISPNFLLMGREASSAEMPSFSLEEITLIEAYRPLDEVAKGAVNALLQYYHRLMPAVKSISTQPVLQFPQQVQRVTYIHGRISVQSVSAGIGTYLDDDMFEDIEVEENPITSKAAFFVPVDGDSMEPRYHDGDILVIRDLPVEHGEIGIFTLDGHGYVKLRGDDELISLNRRYPPIPMNDDIICNGKVVGILDPAWIATD